MLSLICRFSRNVGQKARGNAVALITYLTRIQFDFGALKLLEQELALLGMRRPLIVTDKGVIAAGLWARVKEQLPGNMPVAVYDGTPENPTEAAARRWIVPRRWR
jgi:4-hydroxybutyrate dehydrogenase